MEKLYSKILRSPVFVEDSIRPVALVRDLVIDPNDGRVVAVQVSGGRNMVIAPVDIVGWGSALKVSDIEAIVPADELVRLKDVWEKRAQIFDQRVETEEGKVLGKVVDFVIDGKFLMLKKLYVARVFLGLLRLESRIIPAKNIVEILADRIVVKDDAAVVREAALGDEQIEMMPAG